MAVIGGWDSEPVTDAFWASLLWIKISNDNRLLVSTKVQCAHLVVVCGLLSLELASQNPASPT